jgi:hypothetical protein
LTPVFSNSYVRFFGQDFLISFPEIIVGKTMTVFNRHLGPLKSAGLFTAVNDFKGYNLPDSTKHHCPEPAFIDLFEHKTPGFVEL